MERDGPSSTASRPQQRVAMVCDFFYPRLGGVEGHIWSLSQCLLRQGHKVIVITGSYWLPDGSRRVGVRHMSHGLKVYYLPLLPVFDQAIFPGYFTGLPLVRSILIREGIATVHGHATSSVLSHETLLQAQLMGLRTVYTDHSLYGFDDPAAVNLSRYLSFPLAAADAAIAVSHVGRANLMLRTRLPAERVFAVPNAVDPSKFTPDPAARPPLSSRTVNVVMLSRLVHRKGIDLAVRVIPAVAAAFPGVHFIIGGDGPKRLELEEMRERHGLHGRVEMLGAVPHAAVRSVLVRGHVFLNCSLTEAFCIAILEAACAGCLVVATPVGGVPEVLPPGLVVLSKGTEPGDVIHALSEAIHRVQRAQEQAVGGFRGCHGEGAAAAGGATTATPPSLASLSASGVSPAGTAAASCDSSHTAASSSSAAALPDTGRHSSSSTVDPLHPPSSPPFACDTSTLDPWAFHRTIKAAYSWEDVARRTVAVYAHVQRGPGLDLAGRFEQWAGLGTVYGPVACILMALINLMLQALEWLRPAAVMDRALDLGSATHCAAPVRGADDYANRAVLPNGLASTDETASGGSLNASGTLQHEPPLRRNVRIRERTHLMFFPPAPGAER